MTNFITDIIKLGAGVDGVEVNPNQGAAIATSSLANYVKDRTTNIVKKQNTSDIEEPVEIEVEIGLKADTEAHIPVVYGEAWVTPILVDAKLVNNNGTMWYALALCEKTGALLDGTDSEITFREVYWNNQKLTFWYDGVTVASAWSFNNGRWVQDTTPAFNMKIYPYNNGSNSPTNFLPQGEAIQHGPAWDLMPGWIPDAGLTGSGHAMSNLVFVLVRVDYNASAGMEEIGDLKFKLRNSMKNPGDVFNDYLNNPVYGAGVAVGEIDGTGSLVELTEYANTTIEAADTRQPNVIFSDPQPLDVDLVAQDLIFPVQLSTQPIDIIGPAQTNLKWIVDVSDIVASGFPVAVSFGELPDGVSVTNNAGRYTVSGIQTIEQWDQIKDALIVIPDNFQGSFFYTVEFEWRYRSVIETLEYTVGTFVPVSEIKWAATLTVDSVSILDDGANLTTVAAVNVTIGRLVLGDANLTANFAGEFGTRKITGYSALEFGTFTQNADVNFTVRSAIKNRLLFTVAQLGMISNYRADHSAAVTAISNLSSLPGFLRFADSTMNSEFTQAPINTTNARTRLSGSSVNSQFGITVTPDKIFGIIATPTAQATASIDPVKTTDTASNLTVNAQFIPNVSAILEYDAEFNSIGNFNVVEIDNVGWEYTLGEKIDTSVLPTGATGFGHRFGIKNNLLVASSKITDTLYRMYAFDISNINSITYIGEFPQLPIQEGSPGNYPFAIGDNHVVAITDRSGSANPTGSDLIKVYSIDTVNPTTITAQTAFETGSGSFTADTFTGIGTNDTNIFVMDRSTQIWRFDMNGNQLNYSQTLRLENAIANTGSFVVERTNNFGKSYLEFYSYTSDTPFNYVGDNDGSEGNSGEMYTLRSNTANKMPNDSRFIATEGISNYLVLNNSAGTADTVPYSVGFGYQLKGYNDTRLLFAKTDDTRIRIYNYATNSYEGSFDFATNKIPGNRYHFDDNNNIWYSTADGNNGSSDIYIIKKD